MTLRALEAVLNDLQRRKMAIEAAIDDVQWLQRTKLMNDQAAPKPELGVYFPMAERATPRKHSYVNDAVEILREVGQPLHLRELVALITQRRGRPVSLASVKVSLSRYVDVDNGKQPLRRLSPGLFGLREWTEGEGMGAAASRAGASGPVSLLIPLCRLNSHLLASQQADRRSA